LLDEENRFTSAYFIPFVHIIPFSTRNEVAYAIEFFSEMLTGWRVSATRRAIFAALLMLEGPYGPNCWGVPICAQNYVGVKPGDVEGRAN